MIMKPSNKENTKTDTKQEDKNMKKVNKIRSSKKGFTLVELFLVIAVIVILSGITFVGIRAMLAKANKNTTSVELHAGCFYVEDPNGPATLPGTPIRIRIVDENTPGAQHYSNKDAMYDEVRSALGTVPSINP